MDNYILIDSLSNTDNILLLILFALMIIIGKMLAESLLKMLRGL